MFFDLNEEALDPLHAVIQAHPQLQWEIDRRFRFTKIARSVLKLLGREHEAVIGEPIHAFMSEEEASRVTRFFQARQGGAFSCLISRHLRPDGSTVAIESHMMPLEDAQGTLHGYRGISQGIAGADLSRSESMYRMMAVYNTAPTALCLIGRDGRYLAANAAYAAIFNLAPDALIGRRVGDMMAGGNERARRNFTLLDAGTDVPAYEVERDGRHFQVLVNPVHNLMGQVAGITVALMDITDRKQAEKKLEDLNHKLAHYARNDHLTSLPNRRHVDEVLADEVHRALRAGHPLSVLMLDVDFFKKYNDHYGHLRGDACLRTVAAELKKSLHRHGDLIGRYGGEEFVAVLPGTDALGALKVAGAILHAIRLMNLPHARSHYGQVTLSIGAATLATATQAHAPRVLCDRLLNTADRALYTAKQSGRNAAHGLSLEETADAQHHRVD
ncbi:MAG TPA: sensor domain-containing diguanylate cyclase [Dyella sp.]|uniref:sensor domain-containing diguanylate cyclase n=1 Tax=Dyella sp. TaxID=1869338 RepID=UPI002C55E73A|nr:sensor domain-containing diguanylate cyclase [Dyella sp.]HTV84860.1 sensor domain-containing diguanylate cyclase [Dyella sp.]